MNKICFALVFAGASLALCADTEPPRIRITEINGKSIIPVFNRVYVKYHNDAVLVPVTIRAKGITQIALSAVASDGWGDLTNSVSWWCQSDDRKRWRYLDSQAHKNWVVWDLPDLFTPEGWCTLLRARVDNQFGRRAEIYLRVLYDAQKGIITIEQAES